MPSTIQIAGREFEQRLTSEEVAQILRIPVRTVYAWVRKGDLPCIRHGRRMRFLWSDIEKRELLVSTGKI